MPTKSVKPSVIQKIEEFTTELPETSTFSERLTNILTRLELLQQVQGIHPLKK
ncbi:MAG: hypothetical protein AAGD25_10185 [Cyanobacteria bacterium P01_F01_bin.150]